MTTRTRRAQTARWLASATALALAGTAIGQTVEDQSVPDNTGLNIPSNLQIFGKVDPNIRKATAIINETVITGTDVDQRMALAIAANNIPALPDAEKDRLRLQILRQLIDETLEIQQAKTADVEITNDEINQSFTGIAKKFGKSPDDFRKYLRSVGSSERSMRRQIEGELAWNRYLRRKVEPFVNVGDEEVKAILDRLQAARGTEEYHLNEIYLAAPTERSEQAFANAKQIMGEIQKGQTPFGYFARTYSEASTRSVDGDLGWIRASTLPAPLAEAAQSMQIGQVAGPIPTPGGFSILYLLDKRKVLTADARDARLSLKQMTIKFAPGITLPQATARTSAFATAIKNLQGCGSVEKLAGTLGAEVVDSDRVRVRDLPAPLQEVMLKLQVGQASPPFGSPTDGVRTLVLCGRDDPQSGSLPGADQVQSQLEQERVNLRAQQALRDLRRDAVIEYR